MDTVREAFTRAYQLKKQSTRANNSHVSFNSQMNNMRQAASQPSLIGGMSSHFLSAKMPHRSSLKGSSNEMCNIDIMKDKIILASIDSFHQMTGLILKLKIYYKFLKTYPEYREKVVLFQVIRGLAFKSDNMKG